MPDATGIMMHTTGLAETVGNRPSFLNLLDDDPERAFHEFYLFAKTQLAHVPPAPMRRLPDQDREDMFHDIVLHFVRDEFKVLRQYRETGHTFAAWFYVVAHRAALTFVQQRATLVQYELNDSLNSVPASADYAPVLDKIRQALAALRPACRRLLTLAASEFAPREMARVLGLPPEENKRISDQLRECRRRLKSALAGAGVNWRDCLGS